MDPVAAAQYGMGAFALGVLGYVLVTRKSDNGAIQRVLDRIAGAQDRTALVLERQTMLLEQQGRMLERLSGRVDELWREVSRE